MKAVAVPALGVSCSPQINGTLKGRPHDTSPAKQEKGGSLKNLFKKTMLIEGPKTSFETIPIEASSEKIENSLALIKFETYVAGYKIKDSFLWPRANRSVVQIKNFAVDLLSDIFGPKFGAFDPREIECKFQIYSNSILI